MLLTTDLPIMQISEILGFKTYSVFFKQFKASTNLTPSEYRDLIRQTEGNSGVYKSFNGIYRLESEENSNRYKEKYNTKI